MDIIPKPRPVDLSEYRSDVANPRRLYGLPAEIRFCRRCVYSNQKPNSEREHTHSRETLKSTVVFDGEGICAACRYAEIKDQGIDWALRERQLQELCDRYRSADGSYDCLVPGSGGKDSFYAAHVLKYKYGMHPLTCTWAPHIYTDWGWKNFQAWIHAGFDNFLFTSNGRVHRLLTRLALEKLLHPFQPFILGQYYFPAKLAIRMGLKLIFYGENAAEYGNAQRENQTALKDLSYLTIASRDAVRLSGLTISELKSQFDLTEGDLEPYLPPERAALTASGIEVHHLGFYLRWHPQSNYYYAVEHGGFRASPERTPGTYSKYSSIDDRIDDFHYYTTYIKFGIGRATYDASQEVRLSDITRDEAVALVRRYDGEYPRRFEKEILEYLSLPSKEFPVAARRFEQPEIDPGYFTALCDTFRSPHLWARDAGEWRLRRTVWQEN